MVYVLNRIISSANSSNADIGVYVKSLKTGDTLFVRNIYQPLTPASIMKILTAEAALGNVEWINASAEAFDHSDRSFQLIVIASAFHWMDRPLVASRCRSMLADGGLFAVLGNPTPLNQIREGTAVGAAIKQVQDRWFGDDYYVLDVGELEPHEVVLRECGFSDVKVSYVDQVQEWNVQRFLGFLRSTSSRPDQRLGDQFNQFSAEIDSAIRAVEPSGRWTLRIPVEVIIGQS